MEHGELTQGKYVPWQFSAFPGQFRACTSQNLGAGRKQTSYISFHAFQIPIAMMKSGQSSCLGIYDQ